MDLFHPWIRCLLNLAPKQAPYTQENKISEKTKVLLKELHLFI